MEPLNVVKFNRRGFLRLSGLAGLSWLTPLGHLLAEQAEQRREPAQSLILLWLAGGPSQLETFDPHAGSNSAAGTRAVPTAVKGVEIAQGFEQLADMMGSVSLVRSMVSKEGDHERGTYLMKTGYRIDPTVTHPSIGAICCHYLPKGETEIPRHISILPNRWYGRGGFLGDKYDAFKVPDPSRTLPDLLPRVSTKRDDKLLEDLDVVERAFAQGRGKLAENTLHREMLHNARVMMTSKQLSAFDISREPAEVQKKYGATPFGRACLAARRLIEVGVRCVEVTLDGWDSHINNHAVHRELVSVLDPAFSALLSDLRARDLLSRTVVLCAGEFGRTPKMNPASGRDHWPRGFSLALAGGGIQGGRVVGATDPEGQKDPVNKKNVTDVHATVLQALGIDTTLENITPSRRPIRLSQGRAIEELLE